MSDYDDDFDAEFESAQKVTTAPSLQPQAQMKAEASRADSGMGAKGYQSNTTVQDKH